MKTLSSLALATALGLTLASAAQAQNYAPSVNYQAPQRQSDSLLYGRSTYELDRSVTGSVDRRAPRHQAEDRGAVVYGR